MLTFKAENLDDLFLLKDDGQLFAQQSLKGVNATYPFNVTVSKIHNCY